MQGAAIPHEVPGVVPAPGRDTHVSPYAAGPIPASAGDPSGAAPRRVSGTDYQGVSSQTLPGVSNDVGGFFDRVARGEERLSRWEDQFVWDCRAAGAWWSHIAQAILERRARRREIVAKARKGRERSCVLRWREEYRRERREQAAR
jgi:hypothetical protein